MRWTCWLAIGAMGALPSDAGSLLDFSYGVLEQSRGDSDKAGKFFEKAYAEDPDALPLVRRIAGLRMQGGDRVAAVAAWQGILGARSESAGVWIEYGNFLGDVGRGDAMADQMRQEAYGKALGLAPGSYDAVERTIVFHREEGHDERARKVLETLDTESPEGLAYYVSTTKSLYDSRDGEAGRRIDEKFREAVSKHPERAEIARTAGDHFRQTGRLGEAIEILQTHTAAAPGSLDMRIRLGILLLSGGRNAEGVKELEDVLAVHPGKALAHESLAKQFRIQGDLEKARGHAAEALKLKGGSPDDFLELAEELMADAKFRDARLLLEKAVFSYEDDSRLRMKLAMAASKDPDAKGSAARLFREAELMLAEEAGEMGPEFQLESANELIRQGDTKAAEERLRTAIRGFPKTAKKETAAALRALAGIWISEGRNQDAARSLIKRAEGLEK